MRLFIFRCKEPDTGLACDRDSWTLKAISDNIIDEAQERCFADGVVPLLALRYGIPAEAEPADIIDIVETDNRGLFTLAWDSCGRAWKISNYANDHIWERDMDFDRSQS